MDEATIANFFTLLHEIVNAESPWKEKAAAVRAGMDEDDEANLTELASWFGLVPEQPKGEDEGGAAA